MTPRDASIRTESDIISAEAGEMHSALAAICRFRSVTAGNGGGWASHEREHRFQAADFRLAVAFS
jgi:hypothetical protein